MKFKCYFQVALNKLYTNYNYCTITIVNLQSINLAELIKSWVKCIGWWQGPLADVNHKMVPKTTKIMGFKGFFGGGVYCSFNFADISLVEIIGIGFWRKIFLFFQIWKKPNYSHKKNKVGFAWSLLGGNRSSLSQDM